MRMPPARLSPESQISLSEAVRSGDPAAEELLVRTFRERLWLMMLARTRDPGAAGELVQDVLLAVLTALRNGQVQQVDRLEAFVHGTARNLANNHDRNRRKHPPDEPLSDDLADPRVIEQLALAERMAVVRRALRGFDVTDKAILLLTLVQGLKPGEIAARVGLTPALVRTRKSRALKRLTDRVKQLSRT